ncbi:restriction endonuclease subunit S [Undibacterium umbellatum]|uniref:Restriction endonuclease subunit S n=1 Tax=Undibacterium umbellatum TaxID=2762300 RepID=A0ABR6ZEV2_9BURK|nr:restriction endonuclease subunit S [Undibacterium umbellatum]MBC3910184.1 restriction endonuclease subunit S [Undibacterium umbellatum]
MKNLNIDKSSWKLVKFGDVVVEPKETITDLAASGLEHIVGLEHIDTESIHLRRSAGIEESTTFTKRFAVGDVLFGRRRAYLKKAAQASFDGICSGDITVLRAKKNLLPELLPFIVNNDKFFDYAVKHSAGGLSPRVKFKDLADYEFLLPPKEQQAELAELLWVMDKVIEKDLAVLESVKTLLTLEMLQIKNKYFKKKIITSEEKFMEGKLEDFFVLQRGFDLTKEKSLAGDIPVISSSGLSYYHNVAMCQSPGVITGRKGKIGDVYFTALHYWPHDTTLWVKDFKDNNPKFIYWFLKSINLETFNAATAVPTLNRNTIHPLNIYFPLSEKQTFLANLLDILDNEIDQIRIHIANSKALQKSLINEVF